MNAIPSPGEKAVHVLPSFPYLPFPFLRLGPPSFIFPFRFKGSAFFLLPFSRAMKAGFQLSPPLFVFRFLGLG